LFWGLDISGETVTDAQGIHIAARMGVESTRPAKPIDVKHTYRVELQHRGMDSSKDLPQTVTISAGQTTRLEISIDTSIR
jgi:hypothetical protein